MLEDMRVAVAVVVVVMVVIITKNYCHVAWLLPLSCNWIGNFTLHD
jgi:hypothetical protein